MTVLTEAWCCGQDVSCLFYLNCSNQLSLTTSRSLRSDNNCSQVQVRPSLSPPFVWQIDRGIRKSDNIQKTHPTLNSHRDLFIRRVAQALKISNVCWLVLCSVWSELWRHHWLQTQTHGGPWQGLTILCPFTQHLLNCGDNKNWKLKKIFQFDKNREKFHTVDNFCSCIRN